MTNLTEYSWYYCKMKNGDIEMHEYGAGYFLSGDVPLLNNEVESVLAEVPSFEQWSQTYKTKFEFLEENTKLKELLKECREYVAEWFADRTDVPFRQDKPRECVKKINQVLGEE